MEIFSKLQIWQNFAKLVDKITRVSTHNKFRRAPKSWRMLRKRRIWRRWQNWLNFAIFVAKIIQVNSHLASRALKSWPCSENDVYGESNKGDEISSSAYFRTYRVWLGNLRNLRQKHQFCLYIRAESDEIICIFMADEKLPKSSNPTACFCFDKFD